MKTAFLIAPTAVGIGLVSCRHAEPETPPEPAPPPLSKAEELRLAEQQDRQNWQKVQQSFGKDFFDGAQTASHHGWIIYSRDLKLTADSVESRGPVLVLKNDWLLCSFQPNGVLRVSQLRSDDPSVELKGFLFFRASGEAPHPWSHLLRQ